MVYTENVETSISPYIQARAWYCTQQTTLSRSLRNPLFLYEPIPNPSSSLYYPYVPDLGKLSSLRLQSIHTTKENLIPNPYATLLYLNPSNTPFVFFISSVCSWTQLIPPSPFLIQLPCSWIWETNPSSFLYATIMFLYPVNAAPYPPPSSSSPWSTILFLNPANYTLPVTYMEPSVLHSRGVKALRSLGNPLNVTRQITPPPIYSNYPPFAPVQSYILSLNLVNKSRRVSFIPLYIPEPEITTPVL